MSSAIMAAALRRAERRIVGALVESGATGPSAARPLTDLRHIDERRLRHLLRAGAVREAGPGQFYLDEPAYAAYRSKRRATVVIIMAAIAAIGLLLVMSSSHR